MAPAFTAKLGTFDFAAYCRTAPDQGLDPYGAPFDDPVWGQNPGGEGPVPLGSEIGAREQVWPLYLNQSSKSLLHALIVSLNREISKIPNGGTLAVEWKDQGADASTFYDAAKARFEPEYSMRQSDKGWLAGHLRVWCSPPFGYLANSPRAMSSAAGTLPNQLIATMGGAASPLLGDAPALARVTVQTSGQPVGPSGRGVLVSMLRVPGAPPFISAASFVNRHPSSGLFGASGAPGSQAIYRPTNWGGAMAEVPLGASLYAGRHRVLAAVLPRKTGEGQYVWASDPNGEPLGPTSVLWKGDGWQLVDLGVVSVPTFTPTTVFGLYSADQIRTDIYTSMARPLPSGAPALSDLAVAGVYVLPEDSTVAAIDTSAIPLVRSHFGRAGDSTYGTPVASQVFPDGFYGDYGETWTKQDVPNTGTAFYNASGAFLVGTTNPGGANYDANVRLVRNFTNRLVTHFLIATAANIWAGLSVLDNMTNLGVSIRAQHFGVGSGIAAGLVCHLSTGATTVGTIIIPSQAGQAIHGDKGLVLDGVKQGNRIYLNARWSNATGIAVIPSAGMAATLMSVACVGVTTQSDLLSAGLLRIDVPAGPIGVSMVYMDELVNFSQPSDAYVLTSVTGETPYRAPIAGSGPNVSLEPAMRGGQLALSPSVAALFSVDWQLDGGPMNDLNTMVVATRDRFTFAR